MVVIELITENEIKFLIGIGISLFAGFVIGIEREAKKKPTGIGTITLVVAGAMIFTNLSNIVDPNSTSRIAAQIVTGIGFLGAGIIIKGPETTKVKNVTTAATVWFAAAIGMVIGYGFYLIAIVLVIFAATVPRIPHITDLNFYKNKKTISNDTQDDDI
jgi:putative Mg2+ transporter-C (MgtC) family protein